MIYYYTTMKKYGRNDLCYCNSNKKYKKCCLNKDKDDFFNSSIDEYNKLDIILQQLSNNEEEGDADVLHCIKEFRKIYANYRIVDVTTVINNDTYRNYQLNFYNKKTIMIAKKTEQTKSMFATREDCDLNDIMVMYNGGYRTFEFIYFSSVIKSVCTLFT